MTPSLLAATSPPRGVRSRPSRPASVSDTAAKAAAPQSAEMRGMSREKVFMVVGGELERVFDRAGEVVAVAEKIEAAGAEKVHVAQLERPCVAVRELERDVDALAIPDVIA